MDQSKTALSNESIQIIPDVMYLIALPVERSGGPFKEKLFVVDKTEITEDGKKSSLFLTI